MTKTSQKIETSSLRKNAQALVSAAAAAYKTGDIALAEQMLIEATEAEPGHADALQFLGLVAKGRGDAAQAEKLMRQSIKNDPTRPNVHNNLGNLLKAKGSLDEAHFHYAEAARLDPEYAEAMVQAGECLMGLKRLAEAGAPLRAAFGLKPDYLPARISLADWLARSGQEEEAERLLRDGLAALPDNLFLSNNLGRLLLDQMRYEEAWPYLQAAVRGAPDQSGVLLTAGNCLVGLGRLHDAINHFLKAIDLDPLNYDAHTNVNRILWEMGRPDDVGKSFQFAKQAAPHHPDILEMAAETAIALGRFDEAEADLRTAGKIRSGTLPQYQLWTGLRLGQRQAEKALGLAKEGLGRYPDETELLRKACDACFLAGRPEEALVFARRIASLDPFSQYAAAYQASALRLMGDEAGAARLYDYDRFIHAAELAPPEGYADLESFHAALIPALEALHHADREPSYQSLRGGTQTHENLFDRPGADPAILQLGETVMAAAGRFADSLPEDGSHPFLARRAGKRSWSGSWSVRLREAGHHIDHIHTKGWISGSYYVSTPPCLADEAEKPGWIKFGEFGMEGGPSLPWQKAIRPRPGLLVLFPSYMWHGTIPTKGPDKRLTVAFDITVDA